MSTLRNINVWKRMDKTLLLLYFALAFLGLATIYSTSYNEAAPSLFSFSEEYGKQLFWIIASAGIGLIILLLEGNFLRFSANYIYAFVILLLIGVLFTKGINGAHSWYRIGAVTIQPAEFAKFATALVLARYLSTTGIKIENARTKLITGVLLFIPMALIVIEPDPGTGMVFLSFILVLYREGMSGNVLLAGLLAAILAVVSVYIAAFEDAEGFANSWNGIIVLTSVLLAVGALVLAIIKLFVLPRYRRSYYIPVIIGTLIGVMVAVSSYWAYNNVFGDRHKNRFQVLFGLKEDRQGTGYNIYQALSAIGSGKTTGKGYMEGTLSNDQFQHVPEQSTDFIFCSLAEERGFVGGLILIGLYVTFLIRIVIIAERQRSTFTRIFAYSVCSILFFHFMINMAMVIGLAPVVGIPLPFFSKGGSAILGFSIMIFILLRLDAERKDVLR